MKIFTNIYKYNLWGFGSGTGSLKFNNQPYIDFLNNFLKTHPEIKNIVDLGCGDWQLQQHINLKNKEYLGIDIVDKVILANKKKFEKNNIRFKCRNFLEEDIPESDLLIIKDVLQHLSDENIQKFFNILKNTKYKYILVTNDISKFNLNFIDIPDGMYKPIDITRKPYSFNAELKLEYYEKLYLYLFLLSVSIMAILIKIKGYKLYIFTMGLLLFYGYGILPKKTVYLIKSKV